METNLKILQAAKELFMRYGIKSITMDDLANHLGMSKKTLYQTVENKDELIRQILEQHQHGEKCQLEELCRDSRNAVEEMLKIGQHVIQMLREVSPNTLYDLRKYHYNAFVLWESDHRNFVQELIRQNLLRGQREKLYREEMEVEMISKLYVEFTFALTDPHRFQDRGISTDQLFKNFIEYHLRAITTPAGLSIIQQFNFTEV